MTPADNYGVTRRDLAVLDDMARMRYLKTSQIQTLHFPSRRVTNRRLGILFAQGYIDRFRVPTIVGQGSSENVYCLKPKSEELLCDLVGSDFLATHRPQRNGRPKNSFLMEHHFAINDFWMALRQACETVDVQLGRFVPEYYGERTDNGGFRRLIADSAPDPECPGKTCRFIPDAMFVLERAGRQALFFLEIDRGTETVASSRYAAFVGKVRAYLGYYRQRGFKRWGENFHGFRVLVVTSSHARQEHLVVATTEMGLQRLMWFTVGREVTATTVFDPIWQAPGLEGQQSLIGRASG